MSEVIIDYPKPEEIEMPEKCGGNGKMYFARVSFPEGESFEVPVDPGKLTVMYCKGCDDCQT